MAESTQLKRVTITIDPSMHEKGKVLAKADRRDFSSYVEWLLKRASEESEKAAKTAEVAS